MKSRLPSSTACYTHGIGEWSNEDRASAPGQASTYPQALAGRSALDEYDSYVGGVYRLLASGASCEQVAEHLAELERGPLGYSEATAARNMNAARKLCE